MNTVIFNKANTSSKFILDSNDEMRNNGYFSRKVTVKKCNKPDTVVTEFRGIDHTNKGFERLSYNAKFSIGKKPVKFAQFMASLA